jgi:hypothetical protein
MMHLAILPDWNSLDSVRRAHSDLEAAGLVFFALLVVMEALAHNSKNEHRKHFFDSIGIWFFAIAIFCEIGGFWYGQRNDDLSQQVIGSLDQKTKDAKLRMDGIETTASQLEKRLDTTGTSLNAVSGRAEQIASSLTFMQWAVGARHIQDEGGLEKGLREEFKGKLIVFKSYVQDVEAFMLCRQYVSAATKPEVGVIVEDECADEPLPSHLPVSDLRITAPTEGDGIRLSMILKRPGVSGWVVNLGLSPEITVLIGRQTNIPLFWPKVASGNSKATSNTKTKP